MNERTEEFNASTVRFLTEQDGVPERELKGRMVQLFTEQDSVVRAYLAQVDYGDPDEFNVVLCLRLMEQPEPQLMTGISGVFSDMFRSDEHLDVLILTETQEAELSNVCQPFFDSMKN